MGIVSLKVSFTDTGMEYYRLFEDVCISELLLHNQPPCTSDLENLPMLCLTFLQAIQVVLLAGHMVQDGSLTCQAVIVLARVGAPWQMVSSSVGQQGLLGVWASRSQSAARGQVPVGSLLRSVGQVFCCPAGGPRGSVGRDCTGVRMQGSRNNQWAITATVSQHRESVCAVQSVRLNSDPTWDFQHEVIRQKIKQAVQTPECSERQLTDAGFPWKT